MRSKLLLLLFIISSFFIQAQDFEVSPLNLFFNAEPGEVQTKFVIVKNHSSEMETFILSPADMVFSSFGKKSYTDAGSIKNSIADLVTISPIFFELQPNEEQEVSIGIQQPADEYGSKWGVVFVRVAQEQKTYTADKNLTAGIGVTPQIAINVYQTPGTNKSFKATISNLVEITRESDSTRVFSVVVNNLEDIITSCKIYLIATDIETSEEHYFPETEYILYPKTSRKFELILPNMLPKGTYSLVAILDYGSKTNLEGTQTIIEVE